MKTEDLIHRRGVFWLSFQLDALCTALRYVVPNGLQPAQVTIQLLKKAQHDALRLISGPVVANLPTVEDDITAADMLAIAEVLRGTVLAFLTPDEFEERKQALGFVEPAKKQ